MIVKNFELKKQNLRNVKFFLIYGNNKGQFLIWSNTGDSACIESSIQFPVS